MPSLNVLCLISGGKDSLFSILHCLHNGHRVVALANLHPRLRGEATAEDVDSYMYQTVGHAVIPLFEQALGLPLYRQEITGSAVNVEKSYANIHAGEDETESMVPLLEQALAIHPEINAVNTGAILSDYQRTRVESIAIRLGLTPLSYLWQWPRIMPYSPTTLLEAMSSAGQDSRIIKVASGGLDDTFLWQNVADSRAQARLIVVAKRFGNLEDGAVLGEGGEYETLAVAGPPPLWKGKIVVDDCDRAIIAGEAGVSSIKILKARVEPLDNETNTGPELSAPPLLDSSCTSILEQLNSADLSRQNAPHQILSPYKDVDFGSGDGSVQMLGSDGHLLITNVTGDGTSAVEQMQSIMEGLSHRLESAGQSMNDVAYISIVIADMSEFPNLNAVYTKFFDRPNPPARVTVACKHALPPGKSIILSSTSVRTTSRALRKGLHVQSWSYWAPANVGPYSQAIAVSQTNATNDEDRLVFVAGQIPLVPASMNLPDVDNIPESAAGLEGRGSDPENASSVAEDTQRLFKLQVVLSMQHFSRVGQAMSIKTWGPGIAFIVSNSDDDAKAKSKLVLLAWTYFHGHQTIEDGGGSDGGASDSETFDVWDLKHGHSRDRGFEHVRIDTSSESMAQEIPPLVVVRVDALPRGADIEWATYGQIGRTAKVEATPHYLHLVQLFRECYVE